MSWKKGDILESEDETVTFLGYSKLGDDCFIGENEDGTVSDDYLIEYFEVKE